MRRLSIVPIMIVLATVSIAFSQERQSPVVQQGEIKKLDFLIGSWKGQGWMMFGPNDRRTFNGTEVVQSKLDGTVLVVEGLHKTRMPGQDIETVIHNALGVISYDPTTKNYRFQHYQANGQQGASDGSLTDGVFSWNLKHPTAAGIRFSITINENGQWFEIGERSADNSNWYKFFEMTLDKVE